MNSINSFSVSLAYRSVDVQDDSSDSSSTIASLDIPNLDKDKRKSCQENERADILPAEPMLPPCRICAEKASGFHYGANTCEACKAFFRRSLHKGTMYVCAANGTCDILPGKRNSCAACRLKKCINNGMSKSAIKTGRYTHAKKARDIMEVKGLKDSDAISVEAVLNACNPAASQKMPLIVSIGVEQRSVSPVPDCQEMEQIIQHMTSVQLQHSIWTPEFVAEKKKNEKVYLDKRELHRQLLGASKALAFDEYTAFYQSTGIDVDGRLDLLQTSILPYVETCIKRFVVFVKSIPGFVKLPIKDQIELVKATRFECWMILSQPAFNAAERLYVNHDGRVISVDELNTICSDNPINDDLFEFQGKLQKLRLTEEENCTLAAMCVMSTDNCELSGVELVERSHALLFNCFLHLVNKNHSQVPQFIAHVVSVLVDLRSLREKHSLVEETVAKRWSGVVEIPPILYEMWSSL